MKRSIAAAVVAGALAGAWFIVGRGPTKGTAPPGGAALQAGAAASGASARTSSDDVTSLPRGGAARGAGEDRALSEGGGGKAPVRQLAERLLRASAGLRAHDKKVRADANARSVVEAAQTGRFPERLSALVPPKPFDINAFEADPQAYLDVVEPGRAFQSADGAVGVKALEAVGVAYQEVDPGGSVKLRVTGEAGAPVTFTSFDMGAFENGLASITVLADASGEAEVTFTATAGTIETVKILAGSPLAVGQVKLMVQVRRPAAG